MIKRSHKAKKGVKPYSKIALGVLLSPLMLTACQSKSGSPNDQEIAVQRPNNTNVTHLLKKVEDSESADLNITLKRIIARFHRSSLETVRERSNNPNNMASSFSRLVQDIDPYGIVLTETQREVYAKKYLSLFQYPLSISPREAQLFFKEYRNDEKEAYNKMKESLARQPATSFITQPASTLGSAEFTKLSIESKRNAYIHFKVNALSQFTKTPQEAKDSVIKQLEYVLNQPNDWQFSDTSLLLNAVFHDRYTGFKYTPAPVVGSSVAPIASAGLLLRSEQPNCYTIEEIYNIELARAGLKQGSCLYGITKGGSFQPVRTKPMAEELYYLHGDKAEIVTLHVDNNGGLDKHDWISLSTALQPNKDMSALNMLSKATSKDLSLSQMNIDGNTLNYIRIRSFPTGLSQQLKEAITNNPSDRIVIDLRGNGGGTLTELYGTIGIFFGTDSFGLLTDGQRERMANSKQKQITNASLIVLTDKNTASGAEIFASVIQDSGRGKVIGEQTIGSPWINQHLSLDRIYDLEPHKKGSVQFPIQEYIRLSGENLRNGLTPDIAWQSSRFSTYYFSYEDANLDMIEITALAQAN